MQLNVTSSATPLPPFTFISPGGSSAPERPTFEALFARYEQPVYRFVRSLVGDAEDARDLTQDTFVKVFRALPRLRPHHTQAWVFRIATNVCLDQLRRRRTVRWLSLDALLEAGHAGERAVERAARHPRKRWPGPAAVPDPAECVLSGELTERVQATLDRLLPQHRTVLLLREYGCLSYLEIACAMALTRAAVKSLLRRARQEFRLVWRETADGAQEATARAGAVPACHRPCDRPVDARALPAAA